MDSNVKTVRKVRSIEKNTRSEKTSFLSHISHGIRTPLNAIIGFSKLLNSKNNSESTRSKYIKGILKGSNLLLEFVDNIIDLSQLENDNYNVKIKQVDLNHLIWDFVEGFYSTKYEDEVSDIKLMLVWDSNVNDLEMSIDPVLLKKSIKLLLNIVTKKYDTNEFELGYSKVEENQVKLFIRPVFTEIESYNLNKEYSLYEIETENSFELFNYEVLNQVIGLLRGELCLMSEKNEYWFTVPIIN